MKIVGVIPARYASVRFPGKPLANIDGRTMIQCVYEQASKAKLLDEVIVATDNQEIYDHVEGFGGKVMMTANTHKSGTERCAEVAIKYAKAADIILNIQGDTPYIQPEQIDGLLSFLLKETLLDIATLKKQITNIDELLNPNSVKVITDNYNKAIYFSRHPIPYLRGQEQTAWLEKQTYYKHIGLYAFRRSTLLALAPLKATDLEVAESLEQLRWLYYGYNIGVAETKYQAVGVDSPEDVQKALDSRDNYSLRS